MCNQLFVKSFFWNVECIGSTHRFTNLLSFILNDLINLIYLTIHSIQKCTILQFLKLEWKKFSAHWSTLDSIKVYLFCWRKLNKLSNLMFGLSLKFKVVFTIFMKSLWRINQRVYQKYINHQMKSLKTFKYFSCL